MYYYKIKPYISYYLYIYKLYNKNYKIYNKDYKIYKIYKKLYSKHYSNIFLFI